MSTAVTDNDRYVVISTDSHAGGSHAMYRDYLEKEYLEEFDAWRAKYSNPFRDLQDDGRTRNWDGELRLADQRADGVVAEVTFPNTVPPFFPTGALLTPAAERGQLPPPPRRHPGPQPLDGRLGLPGPERARRRRPDLPERPRRGGEGHRVRRRERPEGRHPAAGRARRRQADRAAVLARLRQALGRLPGQRRHREPALRWWARRATATTRPPRSCSSPRRPSTRSGA